METKGSQFSVSRGRIVSDQVTVDNSSNILTRGRKVSPPITFICWKWKQDNFRTTYTAEHVNIWADMVRRHYRRQARLICITDDPAGITQCETFPLWNDFANLRNPSGVHLPSCYRRLKIFSRAVTAEMDIDEGAWVMSTDLDIVIVQDIETLVHKFADAAFVGWRGVGAHQPTVYNGSLFRFRAGECSFLYHEFDPATSPAKSIADKYFGSDQSWISYRLRGTAPGWTAADGVLSYTSNLGQRSMSTSNRKFLPTSAKIVSFNGKRKPWEPIVQQASPWIPRFWKRERGPVGNPIPAL